MSYLTMVILSLIGGFFTVRLAARHEVTTFTPLQFAIIFLLTVTAIHHIYLGSLGDWLLLANGIGYYLLLLALYWPIDVAQPYRRPLSFGLLAYTLITFVGYFVTHAEMLQMMFDRVGITNKLVELALLLLIGRQLLRRGYLGNQLSEGTS